MTDIENITQLKELESLANETGNPVFIWEAISACENPEQLSPQTWMYLKHCAAQLLSLDSMPKTLPGDILDVFGLTGTGGPGKLKRAKAITRKIEAVRFMSEKIKTVGVDAAAKLAAEKYNLATGTVRGYHYEIQRAKS